MINKRIRREEKIILNEMGESSFQVTNRDGVELIGSDEDYFIYFKNVNFRNNGTIDGRYLGENPQNIIDDKCFEVFNKDGIWVSSNSKQIKTGRLVAVNNKTGVIMVIQNN